MCVPFNQSDTSPGFMTAHAVCSLTLALLGTVGNSLSVFLIFRGRLHTSSHAMMLLVELCLTNLVTTAFILPLVGVNSFHTGWIYGEGFCRAFGYILYITITSESVVLMMITINQYQVIVKNRLPPNLNKYSNSRKARLVVVTAIPWIFSSIIYMLPLTDTWDTFGFDPRKGFCTLLNKSGVWSMKPVLSLTSIVASTVVVIYCYTNIYWTHHQSRRKTNTSLTEAKSRSQGRNTQLVRMITVILINFSLTYIPFLTMTVADSCLERTPHAVYTVIIYVSWSHAATNPIIYALVNHQIQAQWRQLLQPCRKKQAPALAPPTIPSLTASQRTKRPTTAAVVQNNTEGEALKDALQDYSDGMGEKTNRDIL